jgi:hypothetical protein
MKTKQIFNRRNLKRNLFFLCALLAVSSLTFGQKHEFKARVKVDGKYQELSTPFYIVDFYGSAQTGASPSQFKPNDKYPIHNIGEYSQENFGNPQTIKERLLTFKSYGIYPAFHIVPMYNYKGEINTKFGIKYNGEMKYSYQIYNEIYKPILEELKMPHIILIDFWMVANFPPKDMAIEDRRKAWWDILENTITNLDKSSDLWIQFKFYNSDENDWHPGIYFYEEPYIERIDGKMRMQLIEAAGQPGASGENPYNGHNLKLGDYFWIWWNGFTPEIRDRIPDRHNHGIWNIVDSDQLNPYEAKFGSYWAEALKRDSLHESYPSNVGPNYFMGYLNHINTKVQGDSYVSKEDEINFLSHPGSTKDGMISLGVWDEYVESIVLEPCLNVVGKTDTHLSWEGYRPLFVERFWENRVNKFSDPKALDVTPNGWFKTSYYNNTSCSGHPVMIRYEIKADFSFGKEGPGFGVNNDGFSIFWKGMMYFPTSESYTFYAEHDDGVKVEVDGEMLIDQWNSKGNHSGMKSVKTGWQLVKIWYRDIEGDATIKVWWGKSRE